MRRIRILALFLSLMPLAGILQCAEVDLRMERLSESLKLLKEQERSVVDQALELIQKGRNTAALAQLSTLMKDNPKNTSLRVLAAYGLLRAGDLLGAFEEAKKAESSPHGNSYTCWFLARVALLVGDRPMCERELKHVKKAGDMAADVEALEKELAREN